MASQREGAAGRTMQEGSVPVQIFDRPDMSGYMYPGMNLETMVLSEIQARNLIRRAALKPGKCQLLITVDPDSKTLLGRLRLKNAHGGRILMHPADAGTQLAASLGAALERLGILHKLGIAPEPFEGGVPVSFPGGK